MIPPGGIGRATRSGIGRAPLDWPPMGPRDRPRPLPDGATCTACGATVPSGHIRVLARRDDVAFVELACPDCGSTALGLLLPSVPDGTAILDVEADGPAKVPRGQHVAAISQADVAAIRDGLASWDGDLVGWLDALDRDDRRGSVVDR
jgi:hypothetical protein